MRLAKYRLNKAVLAAVATTSAGIGMMQNHAIAATQEYFDVNSTAAGYGTVTGATYSWDAANWAPASGGTTATTTYPNTDLTGTNTSFPRFLGGVSGDTYTVTVASDELNVGMLLGVSGVNLIINQAPSTTGDLNIRGGVIQGFFCAGSSAGGITINAPMIGTGGVSQSQSGYLSLFGNNSFAAGFTSTGGQVTNYNNVNSFGTGTISYTGSAGSIQGMVKSGTSILTIANPILFAATGANFVSGHGSNATPGVIWSGAVTLPATGVATLDSGNATDVTQFSGVITGAGTIAFSNPGSIIFSNSGNSFGGVNLYQAAGKTAGELVISSDANIGGASSNIDFSGGVLGISGNTLTNINSHGHSTDFTGGGFDIQSSTNTFTYNRDMENDGSLGLIKRGAGTLVINASGGNFLPGGGTIAVAAGALVLQGNNAEGAIFNGDVTIPTTPPTTIHNGADIHGKLIFDYTTSGGLDPSAQVKSALTAGYHETSKFSSPSDPLFSSSDTDTTKGLGWKDDGTAVSVMYTYYGDANLDGVVNTLDFNDLASNYGAGTTDGSGVWVQGDFNYDGSVTSSDFDILAGNFGKQLPTSADVPEGDAVAMGALGSVVPEPASIALLALGSAAMLRGRRRRI